MTISAEEFHGGYYSHGLLTGTHKLLHPYQARLQGVGTDDSLTMNLPPCSGLTFPFGKKVLVVANLLTNNITIQDTEVSQSLVIGSLQICMCHTLLNASTGNREWSLHLMEVAL